MKSTKSLLKVIESSLNGIMVFSAVRDDQFNIVDFEWQFVNTPAAGMVSRKATDLLSKRLLEIMPENREYGLFDKYVEVVESGESKTFDVQYADDTMNKWFRVQATKLDDGFVATFMDISNLKNIEAELIRNEKLLTEAMDLANLGGWWWDLADNSVQWSSKVLQFYEIEDSNFRPSYDYFIERVVPEDRESVELIIREAVNRAHPYDVSYRIYVGEQMKYLEARGIPKLSQDGALVEYVGIIKDVTLEKTQQQSQQKAKRVEKAASSERMARSIAHEIRNPLTNISLATEQLRSEVDKESRELFLDMISRNGRRIEDLIKKLMDSSQQAVLDISEHNINDILDSAVTLAMDRIKLRNIKISKDYDQNMCNIMVDEDKVKIALLNIIINAIEAVEDHGQVHIKTRLTEKECLVAISDNGIGIETSQLDHLFDPFYTGKKRGLGLGLTTTLNILNSHDANIEVNSTPGEGTSFTLNFQR